jgi:hypothetical protein
MQVRAFRNAGEFLILATKHPEHLPTLDAARDFHLRPAVERFGVTMALFIVGPTENVEKTWDSSQFKPVRDNQPFLAGNIQHIFSLQQVGSTFIKPAMRPLLQVIGGLFILLLLLLQDSLSPLANLALITPVAFVTGSFFPALFEAAAENPLGVFAADSIGAAIGSMASFFIPVVFGFDWFFIFATVTFWVTALATFLFFRNLKSAAGG